VDAWRIAEPDELASRVRESLAEQRLVLFDVPIRRDVQQRLNYG
jgi:hypothetical protein